MRNTLSAQIIHRRLNAQKTRVAARDFTDGGRKKEKKNLTHARIRIEAGKKKQTGKGFGKPLAM